MVELKTEYDKKHEELEEKTNEGQQGQDFGGNKKKFVSKKSVSFKNKRTFNFKKK